MKRINLVFVLVIVFALFVCASGAVSAMIYVPDNYTKIHSAVDNATEGSTIVVRDGIYNETVNVDKRLTIRSENGSACCFVDATGKSYGFVVTVGYVNITGFTVTHASSAGVYLGGAWYCNISDNTANDNGYCGIWLYSSSNNNMLINNNASNNDDDGIYIHSSNNNTLVSNTANNNSDNGIYIHYSNNTTLTDNIAQNNSYRGIYLENWCNNNTLTNNIAQNHRYHGIYLKNWCNNNTLVGNTASNSWTGIYLESSHNTLTSNTASNNDYGICLDSLDHPSNNNMLTNNTASNNSVNGIYLRSSNHNTLTSNTASNNSYHGISLDFSKHNTLTSNTASNNGHGIYLYRLNNNNMLYHNNLINNTNYNAHDDGTNQWDSGSEGNYYSDYTSTDPDDDGIGNMPHPIHSGSSVDRYPLMQPWEKPPLKGDLDGDDKITSADAAIALQMSVCSKYCSTADVSGDGRVTSLDALIILQMATGRKR
jgi:parallel beta-helix repeat protein